MTLTIRAITENY
nr:unnamed protein product [Callosobruchus chinensis]